MTNFDLMRERLHAKAGVYEQKPPIDLQRRFLTEWSTHFETLMRNRLVMGSMRYETFAEKRKGKRKYNYAREIQRRLNAYISSGNTEFLADIANLALLEFEFPFHPKAHFNEDNNHNIHATPV